MSLNEWMNQSGRRETSPWEERHGKKPGAGNGGECPGSSVEVVRRNEEGEESLLGRGVPMATTEGFREEK